MIKESAVLIVIDYHNRALPDLGHQAQRTIDFQQKLLPALDGGRGVIIETHSKMGGIRVHRLDEYHLREFARRLVLNIVP